MPKVVFMMDSLAAVKAHKDTSYHLMLASSQLGHQVYHLDQRDLIYKDQCLWGKLTKVSVFADIKQPFAVEPACWTNMGEMDAVMVRSDPPFDRFYFYTSLLLDLLPPSTRVFNRPQGLRNWNEKLAALVFPDFTPKTIITDRGDEIRDFMNANGRITIKPIDGHGGKGIVFLSPGCDNLDQLIDLSTHEGRHRVVVQVYVPEAALGDKRILLLNGDPLGGVLRLHSPGKELNNLDAGGSAKPMELSARDLAICAAVKAELVTQGIHFCGLDILGEFLIEINVTSPTGLQELCRFSGIDHNLNIMRSLIESSL